MKSNNRVQTIDAKRRLSLTQDVRQEAVNFSNGLLSATGNEELSTIAFIIRTKTPGGQI